MKVDCPGEFVIRFDRIADVTLTRVVETGEITKMEHVLECDGGKGGPARITYTVEWLEVGK